MAVIWAWQGAVTSTGFRVVTKVDSGDDVRLAVADNQAMSSPVFFGPVSPSAQDVASVTATGLDPDTRYWWAVEHDSVLDEDFPGTVLTDPTPGTPASFVIGAAGDAGATPETPGVGSVLASDRLSNHEVFGTIAARAVEEDWRRFIHLGDMHYYDLGSGSHGISGGGSLANFRRAYDDVLLQPRQHELYRSVGLDYIWDDHDYGPNDSDGSQPGKPNGQTAYREVVPHYTLPGSGGTEGLRLTSSGSDNASTPDSAALVVVDAIDTGIDIRLDTWVPGSISYLTAQYATTGNQRSWALRLNSNGDLALALSHNGTAFTVVNFGVGVPASDGGRITVRAHATVNVSTGDYEAKAWRASSVAGPWTQLGTTQSGTLAGTGGLHNSTAALTIGANSDNSGPVGPGTVYAAFVRNAVGGEAFANPDFTAEAPATGSFDDAAGRTWTVNGSAAIVAADGPGPLYHSFEIGRVLFIVSDTRSDRSPNDAADNASKTMLGVPQKSWIASTLAGTDAEVLVWVLPSQWTTSTPDSWASYQTERGELVDLFTDAGWIDRMCVVGADSHSLYMITRDFTRTIEPFLSSHFPHFHFASLDATPSPGPQTDTGPNSPGRGQFGTVRVQDFGTHIAVTGTGWIGSEQWRSLTFVVNTPLPVTPIDISDLTPIIAGSHDPVIEARVLTTFQSGDDPTGTTLDIKGGDVIFDASADVFATMQIEVLGVDETTGRSLFPALPTSLLSPYAREVFLQRGVRLGGPDDAVLWVPLGYFRITAVEQTGTSEDSITITGSDRMAKLIKDKVIRPQQFPPATTFGELFTALIGQVHPHAGVVFDDGAQFEAIGRDLVVDDSRYGPLKESSDGLGKRFYVDDFGVFRIEDPPPDHTALLRVAAGHGGLLLEASRRLDISEAINGYAVHGEAGGDQRPVIGIAVDRGPSSPTRWRLDDEEPGLELTFGNVPRTESIPTVTTVAQAEKAARELLRRNLGVPYSADFTAVCHPALRPWHPILVVQRDLTQELHIVDTLTIPLDPAAPMTGTTRERTHVQIVSQL